MFVQEVFEDNKGANQRRADNIVVKKQTTIKIQDYS
jgi:hypothetical protein